jgi:hypothetical protein
VFVFNSAAMKATADAAWPGVVPLGDVSRRLIRAEPGSPEMARFKFRKGCVTFYVFAVRTTVAQSRAPVSCSWVTEDATRSPLLYTGEASHAGAQAGHEVEYLLERKKATEHELRPRRGRLRRWLRWRSCWSAMPGKCSTECRQERGGR